MQETMKNEKLHDAIEFKDLKEIIYNSVEKYGDCLAFTIKHQKGKDFEYEDITYKKFLEDVNKLGTAMHSIGIKGKKVAIIGKNCYEWAITHFANLLGNNVSIPLDKGLQYDEFENSLIRSKADVLVFCADLINEVKQVKDNNKTNVKDYICMEESEGYISVKELLHKGEKLINSGEREYIDTKVDENAMSILLFTSGTTSQAKAVMLSQKNIASNIYAMQCVETFLPTDTNIAFLPFHHIFGSTCLAVMLSSGARTVFPDGLRYIKQNLNEYKVSIFVGVPILIEAIYKIIMKEVDKQGKKKLVKFMMGISNVLRFVGIDVRRKIFKQIIDSLGGDLRFIISGGAPADCKISKGFNDLGVRIVQGYGLSETAPVICAENDKYMRSGSVGKPMLNDQVEIVNKDSKGIGEIRVKGPNVMLGYYEMPEITEKVLRDGWFYTGDLGYIDKDGFLFITGRSKNLIVLKNGKKIFPEELETLVNRIDLVKESMVFGLPAENDKNDFKLSVKIVYDTNIVKEKYPNAAQEELYEIIWNEIKELNKQFPRYKHIQYMILTDKELIKTTTNKVKRQEEMQVILENENK